MEKINWQEPATKRKSRFQAIGPWTIELGKLFICLLFVLASIYFLLWPQYRVNYVFKPVTCIVLEKKIKPVSDAEGAGFQPLFLVIYRVDNKTHIAWIYDILQMNMSNPDARKDALRQYSSGYPYTCWYDPANPQTAVLKRSWDRMAILFSVLSGIVMLVTSISFIRWLRQRKH